MWYYINLGCHVHWSDDGVSLKSHHMCCDCGVLTQQSTVKPSVLTIDEWKLFVCQRFAAFGQNHLTATISWGSAGHYFSWSLNFQWHCVLFCFFLLCLLAGQWGNVYSIPSNHVLVSPQEHRGELYPRQDLEINGSPLSMWSHQIVCSVSKEVNYNFKIDCQELWPSLWLV